MTILFDYMRKKQPESGSSLYCPICNPGTSLKGVKPTRIRLVEKIGPYITRYRCMKCGLYFKHQRDPHMIHPYQHYKKFKPEEWKKAR